MLSFIVSHRPAPNALLVMTDAPFPPPIATAMNTDVSWEKSAVTYGLLYDELLKY